MPLQKTILALLLAIPFFSKSEKLPFSIKGKLLNYENVKAIYMYGNHINDTVVIHQDGTFEFSGQLDNPTWIVLQGDNIYNCMIWADSGIIKLELKVIEIRNAHRNPYKQLEINSIAGPAETELNQTLNKAYEKIALSHIPQTSATTDTVLHEFFPVFKKHLQERPASPLLASLLAMHMFQLAEKKELYSLLRFDTTDSDNMDVKKTLTSQIAQLEQFKTGNKIQDFTQNDSTGIPVNLYSIKSKFILLKFWASNCGPCRAENPRLIRLYSQYHSKGLEIVGISLDNLDMDWLKALKKDQTPWINISDLKGWDSDLVKQFYINGIPFSILLDNNYAVVKINPFYDELKEIIDTATQN